MLPESLVIILIGALGLSIGSFLNVVIYRLPRQGLSVSRPARSFCPICKVDIEWYDNIPVISWIILGAKCRACKTPISYRYPLVELVSGILAVSLYFMDGFGFRWAADLYFVLALLAISLIDFELMIIPDHLTVPGMLLGLIAAVISPDIALSGPWLYTLLSEWGLSLRWSSLAGSFLGLLLGGGSIWLVGVFYKVWRGQEGIGDGDLTLLAMIGAFLGWRSVPLVAFAASIFGILAAVPILLKQNPPADEEELSESSELAEEADNPSDDLNTVEKTDEEPADQEEDDEDAGEGLRIPFGPFLSLAALLYLFWGAKFWAWYLPH